MGTTKEMTRQESKRWCIQLFDIAEGDSIGSWGKGQTKRGVTRKLRLGFAVDILLVFTGMMRCRILERGFGNLIELPFDFALRK
jgi:hypothetical protein